MTNPPTPRPDATKKHKPKLATSHAKAPREGGEKGPKAPKGAKVAPPASTVTTRAGKVALVGRPNVGKSTMVNALVGYRLSIVTPKPQTTRDRILGVLTLDADEENSRPKAQLVFLDTPGLHSPKNKLGQQMNAHAEEAARDADVVVFVTEFPSRPPKSPGTAKEWIGADEEKLARVIELADGHPIVLAVNKVDRAKPREQLVHMLEAFANRHPFAAFVPISASRGGEGKSEGLDRLLREIADRLPNSELLFPEDELTDRPERFLAAEQVREQVILQTRDEIPYAVAVTVDAWEEPSSSKGVTRVEATVHVEKEAQRKIVIGSQGARIKEIGIAARKTIEERLGRRIHLGLFVRVEESWANDDRKLAELGYDPKKDPIG